MYKSDLFGIPKIIIFPLIIISFALIFTAFKIHGSSIGVYNEIFFGGNLKDDDLLLNEPRSIRSDEWLVGSPFIISQSQIQFKNPNNLLGYSQDLSTFEFAPVKHWTVIFKPQNWAFFILTVENAYALMWWSKGLILMFGAYFFVYKLAKGDLLLSIGAALFAFFTPFIQWWYSTTAVEAFGYFFFIIFSAISVIEYKRKKELVFYSLLLSYFSICFLLLLYPPFQIPLILAGFFFIIGYLLNERTNLVRERLIYYSLSLIASVFVIILILSAFFLSSREVISIIQNTSYPGKREVLGGGFEYIKVFTGYFNLILQKTRPIPPLFGNESETANALMVIPFILPVTIFYSIKDFILRKKVDTVLMFLSIYVLLLSFWMFVGLPDPLTKGLLLSLSSAERALSGLIAANFLIIFYFISRAKVTESLDYKISTFLLSLASGFNIIFLGYYIRFNFPEFGLNQPIILLSAAVSFLLVFSVLAQRKMIFILTLLSFSIASTIMINPLYRGLDPILNSRVSHEFDEYKNQSKSRWVVYDDLILSNYLVANGFNSLNSTHLYPQKEIWNKFDPDGTNLKTWNRYAHVVFSKPISDKRVEFKLNQADYFTVNIDPCDKLFDDFSVKYFVFHYQQDFSCLKEIKSITDILQPIYIYQKVTPK